MNLFEGDKKAVLLQKYYTMFFYDLLRISLKITKNMSDSEEAVQETFVIAHEKIDYLRDEDKVKNWLITITCNVCKRILRDKKKLVEVEYFESIIEQSVFDGIYYDPIKYIEKEEDGKTILGLIEELKDEYKQVLLQYYYCQKTYEEIAEYLNINIGTVKSRLWRGKNKLKVKISEEKTLSVL